MENAATVFKYRLIPDFNALISHNSIWLDLLYLLHVFLGELHAVTNNSIIGIQNDIFQSL